MVRSQRDEKKKELFQFRVTESDFESPAEHVAFLRFVDTLTQKRKTSDFFRSAVLDAYEIENTSSDEQVLYREVRNYIRENGAREAMKIMTYGEFFRDNAKIASKSERDSYQFLLQYVKRIGIEESINRLQKTESTKVDTDEIAQRVLNILQQQGIEILEEQKQEIQQQLQTATQEDLDLLDDL